MSERMSERWNLAIHNALDRDYRRGDGSADYVWCKSMRHGDSIIVFLRRRYFSSISNSNVYEDRVACFKDADGSLQWDMIA